MTPASWSRRARPRRADALLRLPPTPRPGVRTGVDLVDVARLERLLARRGPAVVATLLTDAERADCEADVRRVANRLAAKEATAKALGTGIGAVGWHDVEIVTGPCGRPDLRLHGPAAARARRLGLTSWSLSLTDDGGRALAAVVASGRGPR